MEILVNKKIDVLVYNELGKGKIIEDGEIILISKLIPRYCSSNCFGFSKLTPHACVETETTVHFIPVDDIVGIEYS